MNADNSERLEWLLLLLFKDGKLKKVFEDELAALDAGDMEKMKSELMRRGYLERVVSKPQRGDDMDRSVIDHVQISGEGIQRFNELSRSRRWWE